MKKNKICLLYIIFLIFFVSFVFKYFSKTPQTQTTLELPKENIFQETIKMINYQKEQDLLFQKEMESGIYTFTNPLIVVNPYNESPLTALILFQTDMPSKISITIPGIDDDTSATHCFSELSTTHTIPVYGLYPNTNNEIILKQLSENNKIINENTLIIQTEQLPKWLDNLVIKTQKYQGDYQNGINYKYRYRKYAFDKNGTIRWFLSKQNYMQSTCYTYLNNHFIVSNGNYLKGDILFYEIDRLGKIYNVFYAPYGVHHDISYTSSGNLLITGSNDNTTQDFLYEIDVSNGNIINTMDFKQILQTNRHNVPFEDWMHNNSVVYDSSDDTIIVSSSNQSTIAKIKWPEGNIKWLLSSPEEYLPNFMHYLLKPIGNNFEYSYSHHNVTILPDFDNNPNTIDILLFDNGLNRFLFNAELKVTLNTNDNIQPENYSRLVHYRINESDMTVEQIWQFGKEQGTNLYSDYMGSAMLLSNNNRLGFFYNELYHKINEKNNLFAAGKIVEVDKNSNIVWDAEIYSTTSSNQLGGYKTTRLPIYFSNDSEHNIYINANNMIPQQLISK